MAQLTRHRPRKHRLRLVRLIVEEGWPPSRAAEFFNVSWRTAAKWA